MPGDPARPWATTALLAAYAAQGRTAEAQAAADVLTTEYAETEHALSGLSMTVRLAAAEGDLATAEAALASLRAGWPELLTTEAAEVLVARLLAGASAGGGTVTQTGTTTPAARASAETSLVGLLGARPNPFAGRTVIPFEVSEAARVRVAVYDVLGREVAVLADGVHAAGRYAASFDGAGLAAGLYLVEARVEPATGPGRTRSVFVERITLLR
jgi:hypothetical protein